MARIRLGDVQKHWQSQWHTGELPAIEIDDVRTLDRLQHVDLFPEHKWDTQLKKLLKAIRAAVSA